MSNNPNNQSCQVYQERLILVIKQNLATNKVGLLLMTFFCKKSRQKKKNKYPSGKVIISYNKVGISFPKLFQKKKVCLDIPF